ncbi:hypothetical protein [Streptomyces chromofuscus]|uniref:Peptidoglycan binding domain-containing protein n=1 Tax=Streptomyces chromofuscus TaxID=42881 RepID=A0A7M2T270_STRCW|nr:hypothetical protein [Streptomyces chromofuscus]QOV42770.1 hypothetical protein IPT68_23595 [Streptomyces chromofuscus]GGS90695.1 hypothetical protein GCM10010254_08230 [Streptomyces chromofuscus]
MSRETDSPSSGPNGRGGTAYPSGTPPYGTPTASDSGADAGRSGAGAEERKTETTLTTRIRINIPGSRPIPPVVVRKPVADAEGDGGTDTEAAAQGAASSPGAAETPAEQQQPGPAEEKTSDWFAPASRKSGPAKPGPGGGAANGTATPGGSAAPGAARPGGVVGSMTVPGGSRPAPQTGARPAGPKGAGLPGATGGPVAPGHGGGTGSFDVTEALTAGPLGNGNGSRPGEPRRDDLPYFAEHEQAGQNGQNGQGAPHGQDPYGTHSPYGGQGAARDSRDGLSGYGGPAGPGGPSGPQGPAGPTGGPVTGDSQLTRPRAAGAPAGVPHPGPGGGLSDDTAILTPQQPAPEPPPGSPFGMPVANVSGDTLTSGIPVVPPADRSTPFGAGPAAGGPLPHTPPKRSEPPRQTAPAAAPKKKKKGRNKLVLLGGGVFAIAGVAYGAGLLMNHSDVPKGTTVLGVDIGGGTRDDAVKKLDEALGDRVDNPLKLSVDGETVSLRPDQSGLQFDADATVDAAARSDYNPVSVIGSLFGQERVVEPVMPVDEEKLHSALQAAAGGAGSATEGTIRFESGKAVAVYGKAGKGIDVDGSTDAVEDAYRTQVATGTATPVRVPTTAKKPTVSNAEVDRMMKEFAEPAMSGIVTVQTDAAHSIAFSPEKSLWKFLRVQAVDGKLVDTYDEAALKELYGSTFDDVLITRGTGQKTPVTVQDVIGALRPALKSTSNRVATIDTDPS